MTYRDKFYRLNHLKNKYPQYSQYWNACEIVLLNTDSEAGIATLNESQANEVSKVSTLPIVGTQNPVELSVTPDMLVWKLDDMGYNLEIELEDVYSVTALFVEVMKANLAQAFIELTPFDVERKRGLEVYSKILNELAATIVQFAAKVYASEREILGLRAKHMTMREDVNDILVPPEYASLFDKYPVLKTIVVVDGNKGFTAGNVDAAKSVLERMGIKVDRVIKVSIDRIKKELSGSGTFVNVIIRHPIIGYIAYGTSRIRQEIHGIGVNAKIANLLDGDDDGDFVEVTPIAFLKDKDAHFVGVF